MSSNDMPKCQHVNMPKCNLQNDAKCQHVIILFTIFNPAANAAKHGINTMRSLGIFLAAPMCWCHLYRLVWPVEHASISQVSHMVTYVELGMPCFVRRLSSSQPVSVTAAQ